VKIIVGVMTCCSVTQRRLMCKQTWFSRLKLRRDIVPVFLVGNDVRNATIYEDTLCLPCNDDYYSLAYKTREFCRWAMTQDFDYLFKCDDDTFIYADRFVSFNPHNRHYIGVDPVDHINPKFASGGAGYWLSRESARIVADMDIERIREHTGIQSYSEDLLVYHALTQKRIHFTQDKRFQAWNQPHRHPRGSNEIITCHYIEPDEMYRMDTFTQELNTSEGYAGFDRGSNTRFLDILQRRFQVDWMGGIGKNDGPILLQESISVIGDWPHREALRRLHPTFTYLEQLDGFASFRFQAPTYDFDYVKLVQAREPLNRDGRAVYVFGRQNFSFPSGTLFDRAVHKCNYDFRYTLEGMTPLIDAQTPCGPMAADKLSLQNKYKFAIACENMIANGYITEKLIDCFISDTVPIYIGGELPGWLEQCVCRVTDTGNAQHEIAEYLKMPDKQYLEIMNRIRDLRFSYELFETFAHRTLFEKAGIPVNTDELRIDGTMRVPA
jgi:Galactosyltransferase/Glycosyltransferase family 10 (fucosyltransferase) C-term